MQHGTLNINQYDRFNIIKTLVLFSRATIYLIGRAMGHAKRAKTLAFNKGDAISVTLTFRRNENFVVQLVSALKYIRKYARAYTMLRLVPELGNGRLHFHYCGLIKNILKHKIFMHNWAWKWGNVHYDTWDQKDTFLKYLEKERLLEKLDIPTSVITNDNFNKVIKELYDKYYQKAYHNDYINNNVYTCQYKPIQEFFSSILYGNDCLKFVRKLDDVQVICIDCIWQFLIAVKIYLLDKFFT